LDDVLIYALYPVTGKRFLKWKYGREQPPDDVKPKTLKEVQAEQEFFKKAKAGKLIEKPEKEVPTKSENARTFNVFVNDEYFEVGVDEVGGSPVVGYVQPMPAKIPQAAAPAMVEPASPGPAVPKAPEPMSAPEPQKLAKASADVEGTPLTAPMPGMIVSYEKNAGDSVSQGETVVILEAMKMENALPAPARGTIKAIYFSSGDSVAKGDVLAVIG
ncbi:MAG: biotin/lipoyl-containing protein, partial [bacterium]